MSLEALALVSLVLAAIPAAMAAINLAFYRAPSRAPQGRLPPVSVLIPARDEERSIAGSVEAALASEGVELEVVVMDDHSRDRTPEIVRSIAGRDPRVRLVTAPPLPAGWCGKQHACQALAEAASHPVLAFVDADVELAPGGLRRMIGFLETRGAELVSGIPRQRTGTFLEKLVIPVIHFVLLGYLPMAGVRWSRHPGFAAGCGQLFVARRRAYRAMGGHAAIRSSRHDGITLPRAFRAAGFKTDLCDATTLASCRMYRSAREVWAGFAKNATEGMAAPVAILPWTILLLGGQVLPWGLLAAAAILWATPALATAALAAALGLFTRLGLAARFRQPWLGAVLHPVGISVVLAIQWYAWWRWLRGRDVAWKGRLPYEEPNGSQPMKKNVVTTSLLAAFLALSLANGPDTFADSSGMEGSLTLRILDLETNRGSVAIAIFDSAEAYDRRDPPVAKVFLPADDGTVAEWTVDGLAPGTYAAMAYQDMNGNRTLDRRKMGVPKEPYGFSNDARATFGPPSFEAAAFPYEGGDAIVEFRLRGGRQSRH